MDLSLLLFLLPVFSTGWTLGLDSFNPLKAITDTITPEPECSMNTSEIVRYNGYPCEEHTVTTADGYILTIFRIPHGRNCSSSGKPRQPLILQHGLFGSSTDWVINLQNQSLGFLAADTCYYDVWLTNIRGNMYCLKHVNMTKDDSKFWQYSWDQMAKYDMPAMIDYILCKTDHKQVYYVGFSMGTTMMFALLSSQPDYNEKIKMFVTLAPVAYISNMTSVLAKFAPYSCELKTFLHMSGNDEFLPDNKICDVATSVLCKLPGMGKLCTSLFFRTFGKGLDNMNTSRGDIYACHSSAGTSASTVAQYGQLVNTTNFQMYDFCCEAENLKHYGQKTPPLYDLTKITAPVVVFYGGNDSLADPKDVVNCTLPRLKTLAKSPIFLQDYSHSDFVYAINATTRVYDELLNSLQQCTNNELPKTNEQKQTPECKGNDRKSETGETNEQRRNHGRRGNNRKNESGETNEQRRNHGRRGNNRQNENGKTEEQKQKQPKWKKNNRKNETGETNDQKQKPGCWGNNRKNENGETEDQKQTPEWKGNNLKKNLKAGASNKIQNLMAGIQKN